MKSHFIVPEGHYFLSHSVGCQPRSTKTAVASYLEQWGEKGGDAWPHWLESIAGFKQSLGRLLGGQAQDYCPQVNLSSALTKVIQSLPEANERTVILATEMDFPSMGFVLATAKNKGYEVAFLSAEELTGQITLDQWQQALNTKVKLAFITHGISETGQLQDVQSICQLAKEQGVMTLVDVAQSVGIVPISVSAWEADIVIGSCVKWSCGGPGAGFIYLTQEMQRRLTPVDLGWFSHQDPFVFDIDHFEYAQDASRFMGGTPSVLPFVVAAKGIETITEIGIEQIWQHNRKLSSEVMFQAMELGLKVVTPASDPNRSGTLVLDFADRDKALTAFQAAKIKTDLRPRFGFRFSLHIYNDMEDVEALLETIKHLP